MTLMMILIATVVGHLVLSVPVGRPPSISEEETAYEVSNSPGTFEQIQVVDKEPRPPNLDGSYETNYIRPPVSQYVPSPPHPNYRPQSPYTLIFFYKNS